MHGLRTISFYKSFIKLFLFSFFSLCFHFFLGCQILHSAEWQNIVCVFLLYSCFPFLYIKFCIYFSFCSLFVCKAIYTWMHTIKLWIITLLLHDINKTNEDLLASRYFIYYGVGHSIQGPLDSDFISNNLNIPQDFPAFWAPALHIQKNLISLRASSDQSFRSALWWSLSDVLLLSLVSSEGVVDDVFLSIWAATFPFASGRKMHGTPQLHTGVLRLERREGWKSGL